MSKQPVKALMRQLFPAECEIVPELRFPEFSGDWEEKKLGDVAKITTGSSNREDSGLDGQYTFFDRSEDIRTSDRYLFDGKAVIVAGEGSSFPPKYFEGKFDLHQRTYAIMEFVKADSKYIFYFINKNKNYLLKYAVGSTVKSLRLPIFQKMPVNLPSLEEQTKIAIFLSSIDELITAHNQKLESLKAHKKGLMRQLFPAEGETVPKLRFPEFSGEWEEKKLDDVGSFKSGTGFTEAEQGGKSGVPFFKVSDMNLEGNQKVMVSANNYVNDEQIARLNYKPINKKSVIFAKVGAAVFLERKRIADSFLIDNNMMAFTPTEDIDFIRQWFDTVRLSKYAQVGALPSYNASDLKTIKINLPSLPEQTKIAIFLSSLDDIIVAQTQKIEALKSHKNGLMQQLFPAVEVGV